MNSRINLVATKQIKINSTPLESILVPLEVEPNIHVITCLVEVIIEVITS